MATKDDIADLKIELKGDIARVQEQVNSIEAELKYGRWGPSRKERDREEFPINQHFYDEAGVSGSSHL